MPPSRTAVDPPPEAALVEPLLPTTTTTEAAVVSVISEDESPSVGTSEQPTPVAEPGTFVVQSSKNHLSCYLLEARLTHNHTDTTIKTTTCIALHSIVLATPPNIQLRQYQIHSYVHQNC